MDAKVNMNNLQKIHAGTFQALVEEFEKHRLPRLLRLKDKVDRGETINDVDLDFLCKQIKDACLTMHLTVNYPELVEFSLRIAHLCKELCEEAVENEKK